MEVYFLEDKKQVIMIKGDNSKFYEQVIFILRPQEVKKLKEIDFVNEAQKIINNYMTQKYNNTTTPQVNEKIESQPPKKNKEIDKILNICIVLCCILLGTVLYFYFK